MRLMEVDSALIRDGAAWPGTLRLGISHGIGGSDQASDLRPECASPTDRERQCLVLASLPT